MILIIDDDKVRMELKYDLIKLSFPLEEVIFCQYPENAERYLQNHKQIKLIILDVMFAGISDDIKGGFIQGITWFKNNIESKQIPTIFYSNRMKGDLKELLIKNNVDIIKYPYYNKLEIEIAGLIKIIDKIVK